MSNVQIDMQTQARSRWSGLGRFIQSPGVLEIPIQAVTQIFVELGYHYSGEPFGITARDVQRARLTLTPLESKFEYPNVSGRESSVVEGLDDLDVVVLAVRSDLADVARAHTSLIRTRLSSLRNLEDGWLEGDGVAPSPGDVDWLIDQFEGLYNVALPMPYTYPTPEGGVQCEWRFDPQDITLEVDLESRTAAWHRLDLLTEDEDTRSLNLNARDDWRWLCGAIRQWSSQQRER